MPRLGNTKLTDTDFEKLELLPNIFAPVQEILQNFAGIMTIPNLLLPKLDINLPVSSISKYSKEMDNVDLVNYSSPENFGFKITVEGTFVYQAVNILGRINLGTKAGKYFQLLLTSENNFVSDKRVKEQIEVADDAKGVGYIRKDFIKALKQDGFVVKMRRTRGHGSKLINISVVTH